MAGVRTKTRGKSASRRPRRRANNTVSRDELLVDGNDFHFRKFVHDSLAFAARLTAVRDGYARLIGVSGPQYTIIISIAHLTEKGPVTVSDIASHLHLSGSFVTNECKKLTEFGLISKSENDQDRRRVNLEITDDGWERLDKLSGLQSQVNDVHFGNLTRDDFDRVREIMPRLVASTDRALSLLRHIGDVRVDES